jgi:NTP pyrophosphatase (non-canonical NTP hydrolase)
MNAQIQEALDILQEECAEVIVEVSKCRRFGLNSVHYSHGIPHRTMLERELGDVLAMIDILVDQGIVDPDALDTAKKLKRQKLQQWSNIFSTHRDSIDD